MVLALHNLRRVEYVATVYDLWEGIYAEGGLGGGLVSGPEEERKRLVLWRKRNRAGRLREDERSWVIDRA